jgi:hypothetical protein
MRVINCKSWEEVSFHRSAWQGLQDSLNVPIFSTYEFLECFWNSFKLFIHPKFGHKKELNVLFFYEGEELVAVLPMLKVTRFRKKFIPIQYLELLGQSFFTSNLDLITKKKRDFDWSIMINWIKENIRFHVLSFQLINDNSNLYHLISPDRLKTYSVSPMIVTDGFQDFEDYKKRAMSKNFQKILSNSTNRIQKTGRSYSFEWTNYVSESHYQWVNQISSSKKKDGKYNVFDYPEMRQFVESVFKIFNAQICTLFLDGSPIAYQVYLYYKNQCMWFDLSFDRDYRDLRPGILIYEEGLKYNFKCMNILGYGRDQNKMGIANVLASVYMYKSPGNIWGSDWLMKLLDQTKK